MKTYLLVLIAVLCVFPSEAGKNKQKPILVGSYNLRYDNNGDGINAWSNRKEWVKELIRFYDWDIFGTQEGLRHQLTQLAEMDEYAFVGAGRDDGKEAGEHSAIFYRKDRFKLLDSGNFWFSETPDKPSIGWDAPSHKRICSWAKLKDMKTKKVFFFFSAHFDHQGKLARVESAKLMLTKIEEIAQGIPTIFVGDLNSMPNSEVVSILDTKLGDSYKVTKSPPYGPVGTANGFKWERPLDTRIDYIYVTPGIDVLKYGSLCDSKDQRYPSDHLPILSEILLP